MILYKIFDKKNGDKIGINKIFFGGDHAQVYADDLNIIYKPHRDYKPIPFMYILTEEEKDIYRGTIKPKKLPFKKPKIKEKILN